MLTAAHSDALRPFNINPRARGCTVWVAVVLSKELICPAVHRLWRTMFARRVGAIADPVGLKGGAINLRIVPCPLQMPDISLGSIEPLIVIVLGCMRRKGAQVDEVRG
jgi:hypothetical protein